MRREASLELWKSLYKAAVRLMELAPWENFWDTDLVAIQLKDKKEPVFMSIAGRGIAGCGVTMYEGERGLEDFDLLEGTRGEEGPFSVFALREQQCVSLSFVDREDVPKEQRDRIKELNLSFRGRGKWPCFLAFEKAYAPWTPDERQVSVMAQALWELCEAAGDVKSGKVKIRYERGEHLWRSYDSETGEWRNYSAPVPDGNRKYPLARLRSQDQIEAVKSRPRSIYELCMDLFYMNAEVMEEGYDKPFFPRAFLVVDKRSGKIANMQVLEPRDSEVNAILHFLLTYVMKNGRPRTIYARNPWIFAALTDTCKKCGIPLVHSDLEEMEELVEQLTDAGTEEGEE